MKKISLNLLSIVLLAVCVLYFLGLIVPVPSEWEPNKFLIFCMVGVVLFLGSICAYSCATTSEVQED